MESFRLRFEESLTRFISFAIVALSISFTSYNVAQAETYELFGIPFPVELLKAVDANNVEVSVFGETKIVAKSSLDHTVVTAYFENPQHRFAFPSEAVQGFVTKAVKAHQPNVAASAMLAVLTSPKDKEVTKEQKDLTKLFLENLDPKAQALITFQQALELLSKRSTEEQGLKIVSAFVSVPVFEVGLQDLAWLRAHAIRLVFNDVEAFKEYTIERLSRLDIKDKDSRDAILALVTELFGQEDAMVVSLKRITMQLGELEGARRSNQIEGIYPLAATCEYDRIAEKLVCPHVTKILEEGAERLLDDGQATRALTILSHADFHRRTPKTHELLLRLLEGLKGSEISLLNSAENAKMLRSYSAVDENIREAFGDYLERQIEYLAQNDQIDSIDTVLANMIAIRPDPDSENDRLRVDQALRFVKAGLRARALNELDSVRTGLGLYQRLRLGLSGLYMNQLLAMFLLIMVLGGASWYARFEFRRLQAARREAELEELERARLAGSGFAMRTPGESIINHELREYEALLQILALEPEASLKEIKTAYRQSVKQFHPDAQQTEMSGQASQQFIELTNAYDRILELRIALGLDETA